MDKDAAGAYKRRKAKRRNAHMASRNLLFLTGLGAPAVLFTPWFKVFQWFGYEVHAVPNSRFSFDPVTTFAEHTV